MIDTNGDPLPSITDMLRARTKPHGTANVIYLELGGLFYDRNFIQQCIEELERIPTMAALGEMPSPLQKLAYDILITGCHLDQDIENAQHRSKDQACPSGLKTKIGYTSYAKTKFEPKALSQKEQEAELKRFKI